MQLDTAKSVALPELDHYIGIQDGSARRFTDGSIFFKSKASIDGDGSGGNREHDPCYQSDTALHDANDRPLNARECPFIVMPLVKKGGWGSLQSLGAKLGDLVWCYNEHKGMSAFGIIGDLGPKEKIGEISIRLAEALGINPDPNHGGISNGLQTLIFTDTRGFNLFDFDEIQAKGNEILMKFLDK